MKTLCALAESVGIRPPTSLLEATADEYRVSAAVANDMAAAKRLDDTREYRESYVGAVKEVLSAFDAEFDGETLKGSWGRATLKVKSCKAEKGRLTVTVLSSPPVPEDEEGAFHDALESLFVKAFRVANQGAGAEWVLGDDRLKVDVESDR